MRRKVVNIIVFLWLGLGTSFYAVAETVSPLPGFQDNSQNFLEGIIKGQWLKSFTQDAAGSLALEAGARDYRLDATLGWNLTLAQRVKLTGEYLRQDIDYTFSTGTTRQWAQQSAVGLDYQYQLTANGLNYFDLSSYYSHAPNIQLDPVSGSYFDNQNNLIQYTDFKRIAGSKAYGISPAITLNPWQGAQTTFAFNYDHVDYDIRYANRDHFARGFGGTFTLNQQVSQMIQINLSAGARTPFNTYQAGIQFTPPSNLSVGLIGNYTQGKDHLPDTSLVGIEFTYAFDKNVRTYGKSQNANACLNSWVQKPAAYLPQVLAVADEALIITSTQPTSPDALPAFLSSIANIEIESTTKEVNISTASHFSGNHLAFSATHLASGLSIDSNTGIISGQATASSNNVVVTATNASGSAQSNVFNVTVTPPCVAPAFSGNIPTILLVPPVRIKTAPYFTGTDLVFSATNLAEGLSIDPNTGLISGFTFIESLGVVVTATNRCGSAQSNTFSLL